MTIDDDLDLDLRRNQAAAAADVLLRVGPHVLPRRRVAELISILADALPTVSRANVIKMAVRRDLRD